MSRVAWAPDGADSASLLGDMISMVLSAPPRVCPPTNSTLPSGRSVAEWLNRSAAAKARHGQAAKSPSHAARNAARRAEKRMFAPSVTAGCYKKNTVKTGKKGLTGALGRGDGDDGGAAALSRVVGVEDLLAVDHEPVAVGVGREINRQAPGSVALDHGFTAVAVDDEGPRQLHPVTSSFIMEFHRLGLGLAARGGGRR